MVLAWLEGESGVKVRKGSRSRAQSTGHVRTHRLSS